jgi:hypothetical protein
VGTRRRQHRRHGRLRLGVAANGNGHERYAGSSWVALYTVALFGNVIVLIGLPALVHAQSGRSPVLTRIGYAGIFVPLVILNIGEGAIEGFAKPYLATHGGNPSSDLPGLAAFEAPALLVMLAGVLFIVVPFLGAAGLQGADSLAPDYLLFVGLCTVGVTQLCETHAPLLHPAAQRPSHTATK